MPNQRNTMRVLGTNLPSTQTVHERVFGGMQPGRPVVVKPRDIRLKSDKSNPIGYQLLWQKIKPDVLKRAEDLQGTYMPPALTPSALSYVNNKRKRPPSS